MNDNEYINNINEYFKNLQAIKLNIYFVKGYDYLPFSITIEEINDSYKNNNNTLIIILSVVISFFIFGFISGISLIIIIIAINI